MTAETLGWADAAVEDWGACGVAVRRGGRLLGYLLLAPAWSTPIGGASSATPVSSDAAVVVKVWIDPEAQGAGVDRQLVQAAAGFAHERRIAALEAVGTYGPGTCAVWSVSWLRRTGFQLIRNHPLHPLLRLDLSSTVGWPQLESGWRRLAALLQRPGPAEPAGNPWRTGESPTNGWPAPRSAEEPVRPGPTRSATPSRPIEPTPAR